MGFMSAPKVQSQAPAQVKEEKARAGSARKNLFATAGDQVGEELLSGQVSKRESLFGN
jgi:hypothetical protein